MLIGMIVGAYSSVFIAVPLAVDLKMRDPLIKAHTTRVLAKRKADGLIVDADGDPIGWLPGAEGQRRAQARRRRPWPRAAAVVAAGTTTLAPGAAPSPGVKPVRPSGKRAGPSQSSGSSSGKSPGRRARRRARAGARRASGDADR